MVFYCCETVTKCIYTNLPTVLYNKFINGLAERQNATLSRNFERAENVYKDFLEYETAMEQYANDYQQYLVDYEEWFDKYGSVRSKRQKKR